MPSVIHKDTVEGAQLQTYVLGTGTSVKVRGALVKYDDLPSGTPDPFVLEKCIQALGTGWQLNEALTGSEVYSGGVPLKLKRHIARARSADVISIQAYYEPLSNVYNPGSWILRDESTTVAVQTNLEPGTRRPVKVGWVDPADPHNFVPPDYCMYRYMAPFRTILIQGTMLGRPPYAQRQAIRHVNNDTWLGYPLGYWLVDRYSTTVDNTGTTAITCQVSTWDEHDWSEYSILRNQMTGRFVQVKDEDVDALVAMPYIKGQRRGNGFVRIGPYRLVNLSALFGDFPLDLV